MNRGVHDRSTLTCFYAEQKPAGKSTPLAGDGRNHSFYYTVL